MDTSKVLQLAEDLRLKKQAFVTAEKVYMESMYGPESPSAAFYQIRDEYYKAKDDLETYIG